MRTPAVTARLAQTDDAASLVLEAERVALAEVEQCNRKALCLVAAAWLRAELVHKRTDVRIKRLRERMTSATQVRQVQIRGEMETLAGDVGADASILELTDGAIARVSDELAGLACLLYTSPSPRD